jgi:8-oxo-dGTP diphosphatase
MKTVTAAIIVENDKVLIARRKKGEWLSGYWEFPGGKLEDGETLQSCLKRELSEELGVQAEVGEIVAESEYHGEQGIFRIIALLTSLKTVPITLSAHDRVAWVPLSEISSFKLSPADRDIARTIIEKQNEICGQLGDLKSPFNRKEIP